MNGSAQERTTTILCECEQARPTPESAARLTPLLYDELRALAARYLNHEHPGHTLQPTALVHEAYVKLVDQTRVSWRGRTHFFAVAAVEMKRVLIDHARFRGAAKRGGGVRHVPLSGEDVPMPASADGSGVDPFAVVEAVERLARINARWAEVVTLRFLAGLSVEDAAAALEISPATCARDWTFARAWLRRELGDVRDDEL